MLKDLIRKDIEEKEGIEFNAYLCSSGVATIGAGFTWLFTDYGTRKVKLTDVMTKEQYEIEIAKKVDYYLGIVKHLVTIDLNDNQIRALVSFVYNFGGNRFKSSTLLKKINAGQPIDFNGTLNSQALEYYKSKGVTELTEFHRWVFEGGEWTGNRGSQGLANRRIWESNLYKKK